MLCKIGCSILQPAAAPLPNNKNYYSLFQKTPRKGGPLYRAYRLLIYCFNRVYIIQNMFP